MLRPPFVNRVKGAASLRPYSMNHCSGEPCHALACPAARRLLSSPVSSHTSPDYGDKSAPPSLCQNCSAPLTGPFCAACGQHDVDYHRGFHHLFHDLLENVFHFEGKFFVTVAWLLAKPGRITLEFIAGRRASQLNPLRFYIFVSVMFFLGVSLLNHGHLVDIPRKDVDQLQLDLNKNVKQVRDLTSDFTAEEKAELIRRLAESAKTDGKLLQHRDAVISAIRAAREKPPLPVVGVPLRKGPKTKVRIDRSSWLGQRLGEKLTSGELTVSDMWDAIEHRIPTLLFLGVPLFALLLKIFYIRSGKFYVEHLIFSLHLHTWLFLVIMVGNGYLKIAALGPSWLDNLLGWTLALWSAWYFFRSFRVVYGQGRFKTAVKIALLGVAHFFALLFLAFTLVSATVAWLAYE